MLVAVGLTFALAAGAEPAVAAELPPGGTFADDDGNVHEGYIEAIAREGVTSGCGGDRYCPSRDVTRGEMAAFIRRAVGLPASSIDRFGDDDGHRFEGDINALAAAGITDGCRGGRSFCADRAVKRGEMAKFIRRAMGYPHVDRDHFGDDDRSVFEADIDAIAARGVTKGCNPPANDQFCPQRTVERDQMASFLGRMTQLTPTRPPPRPAATLAPRDYSVDQAIEEFFADDLRRARSIVDCESSFNPRAVNPAGYHGLFQIGSHYHTSTFRNVTGVPFFDGVYVPYYNAEYARYLYDRSGGWGPWGCA